MNQPTSDAIARPDRWVTVPNALCMIRFLGSWLMLYLAYQGEPRWVIGLFLFLTATDWVDGKIAVLLDQRSAIGPRIDTIADVTMYGCLLASTLLLHHAVLIGEFAFLFAAVGSYATSCLFSVHKFRRIPSYHTRAAKTCWLLMIAGVLSLFMGWSIWPLRIALVGVTLTNLEAILITFLSDKPLSDVKHVGWAMRRPRESS